MVDDTIARHGRIDVLVNNAAITKHKQIWHLSADEVERVMSVNFLQLCLDDAGRTPAHAAWRDPGRSSTSRRSRPRWCRRARPPYGASKAALHAFTQGLWSDLEGSNLHAALVIPGAIDTEIWEKGDEPLTYAGRRAPPQIVSEAIFEAIEKRRHEITVPRRRLDLNAARALRRLWPAVLRAGMRRMDPVPAEVVERARERARQGWRLGRLD